LAQVFLAGLGLFDNVSWWLTHGSFGYGVVHPIGLVLVIFAAISKLPRRDLLVAIVTVVYSFFMPVFATLPGEFSFAAALHPVSAFILFGLTTLLIVWSRELVPPPWGRMAPPAAEGA
ncbi:MAG: DUF6220 domain-containing protein, partial [Thermoplasmata archaeon]|nr:DUF6220 domain-containing protein [Thermoplasmata archaeon]